MIAVARELFRGVPGARWAFRTGFKARWSRELDLMHRLEPFVPSSAGTPRQRLDLALQDARDFLPRLEGLTAALGREPLPLIAAAAFPQTDAERNAAANLAVLFDHHGSDKSTRHDYHHVYGAALERMGKVSSMLEVGLGTNNTDTPSNMGSEGRPGASLRAFRDYLPQAMVYGADVDRRVLFSEDRIGTFYVDQTNPETFSAVAGLTPPKMDLVIDDGLHSPAANLTVLDFAISKVRVGGFAIVEDILEQALPAWQVTAALMEPAWTCQLVAARMGFLFVAQRKA